LERDRKNHNDKKALTGLAGSWGRAPHYQFSRKFPFPNPKRKNRKDKAMDGEERVLRLQKKLEHWIEHNKEHAESFRKAAREAEEIGLVEVGKRLREAAKSMDEISALLEKAMKEIS